MLEEKTWISGLIFLLILLFGCGLWGTRKPAVPGITKLDYERGCGSCHKAPKPGSKTDDEWQRFIIEHRFLSGHDKETAQLFADYLKRKN